MWFEMPIGTSGISVERQEFVPEIMDEKGVGYFRAPDHFAPRILEFKGFKLASKVPEGAPADFAQPGPQDAVMAQLIGTTEAQKDELQNLHADLLAANAQIRSLVIERDELKGQVARMEDQITALQEANADLEDKLNHAKNRAK